MKIKNLAKQTTWNVIGLMGLGLVMPASAALVSYYVGVDSLGSFTSGTYAGEANPNHQRLTFLFAHWMDYTPGTTEHFHSIGRYELTGPAPGTVTHIGSNYQIPEAHTGLSPMVLTPMGSGPYAGRLVAQLDAAMPEYTGFDFAFGSVTGDLAEFPLGTHERALFDSSGGRWSATGLAGADTHLELVSITPGLNVGTLTDMNIFGPDSTPLVGTDHHLGIDDVVEFAPVFWAESGAEPGDYSVVFRLTDESGTFGNSGDFRFNFRVIPEPAGASLALLGGVVLIFNRRRATVVGATRQS
jgi:hypothetical protein